MSCSVHHMIRRVMFLAFLRPNFYSGLQQTRELEAVPVKSDNLNHFALITWKWCNTGHKLVWFTNRKLHTGFRLVPKLVTLIDLGHYFTKKLQCTIWSQLSQIHCSYSVATFVSRIVRV